MSLAPVKPILVSGARAREILGIGETKFWKMVKAGKIRLVNTGTKRRMVDYKSLEALVSQNAA